MSRCLAKLPHSCGTRKGLQVFERDDGTVDSFCFSCRTYIRHPYGDEKQVQDLPKPKIKSSAEIEAEIKEVHSCSSIDVPSKRLRGSTMAHFGVKVGLCEENGETPRTIYYPYYKGSIFKGYKVKLIDDDGNKRAMWSLGDLHDVDFFGLKEALEAGARKVIITEGEDDALTWRRVLDMFSKDEYKNFTVPISLPHGVHNAKDFMTKHYPMLKKQFNEIVLCFDMDKQGQDAVREVSIMCPGVTTLETPEKDANECVKNGKAKALYNSLFKTVVAKNTRFIRAEDIHEEAKEPPVFGELTWPWDHLNEATRGIRLGETVYFGAGVKMGKSEILNAIAAHFIMVHDVKVLMAKLEEPPKKTYKLVLGKVEGRFFHDPKKEFDEGAYDRAGARVREKLIMLDRYQQVDFETLKQDIIAGAAEGVKAVFIDPITNLTVGLTSGEVNTRLKQIAVELSNLAADLNIVIFLFCHLKAHDGNISKEARQKAYSQNKYIGLGNCPHEKGGNIESNQFAGSRAMMQSCNIMLGLEGNKDEELGPEIRNLRNIRLLEEREFGDSGVFPLYWNNNTSIFEEL